MVEVNKGVTCLKSMAPISMLETWDNVGLQIGSLSNRCQRIGVCLDLTETEVAYAHKHEIDLLLSHHPLLFQPLHRINTDSVLRRLIKTLLALDIAVYASHTNFDLAPEGLNAHLAYKLGLTHCKIVDVKGRMPRYKLLVFVPSAHLQKVREAIFNAGGGHQGNYDRTSFWVAGWGTFRPLAGAQPFIGDMGFVQEIEEQCLEVLVSWDKLEAVVQAVKSSHPYEEVIFDVLTLVEQGEPCGMGGLGSLSVSMTIQQLMTLLINRLEMAELRLYGSEFMRVARVAICCGSGGDLIEKAHHLKADVLITADVGYHQAQQAVEMGLVVIDAGHCETEKIFGDIVGDHQKAALNADYGGVEISKLPVKPLSKVYTSI